MPTDRGRLYPLDQSKPPVRQPVLPHAINEKPRGGESILHLDEHHQFLRCAGAQRPNHMPKIQVTVIRFDGGGCSKGGDGLTLIGVVQHVGGGPKEGFILLMS